MQVVARLTPPTKNSRQMEPVCIVREDALPIA